MEPDVEEAIVACPYCPVGCRYMLRVRNGRAVEVIPLRTDEVSRGRLCIRGWDAYGLTLSEGLRVPEVGRGEERRTASWEEALEFVARRLREIVEAHGPESVAVFGSPFLPTEDIEAILSFASAIGTPNVDDPSRAERAALPAPFPKRPEPLDFMEFDLVLAIGAEFDTRNPILTSDLMRSLKPFIVVSPRTGRLTRLSALHLKPRPGGEAAVLAAVFKALKGMVGKEVPTLPGAPSPGVPLEEVEKAAMMLSGAKAPAILLSLGLTLTAGSSVAALAKVLAEAVGARLVLSPSIRNERGCEEVGLRPRSGGLPAWEALEGAAEGKVRAILCLGDDPLLRLPDVATTRRALERAELVVVAHCYEVEAMQYAHAVLPLAKPFEVEGTVVNLWGRRAVSPAVFEPNGRKPLREVLERVAEGMGKRMGPPEPGEFVGLRFKVEELPVPEPLSPTEGRPLVLSLTEPYPWEAEPLALNTIPNLEREYSLRALDHPIGYVLISPADSQKLKVRHFARAVVESATGRAELFVRVDEEIPEGAAFVPFHLRGRIAGVLGDPKPDPLTDVPTYRPVLVNISPLR